VSSKEHPELRLYEQIIEEMLEPLRRSDLFEPGEVDQLRKLAESKRLHRTETVIDLLRGT
jgi:hypothetical protein